MTLVKVVGPDHVVVKCADVEASLAFSVDTLGLEPVRRTSLRILEASEKGFSMGRPSKFDREFRADAVELVQLVDTDSIDAAIAVYRSTWFAVDAIIAEAKTLDALCHDNDPPTNLRWLLLTCSKKRPVTQDTSTSFENSSTA